MSEESGLKSVTARVVKEGEWMDDLLTNVEEALLREAIIQTIDGLPDKQKTVLHLRFGLCFQQDDKGNWLYPQSLHYKSLIDDAVADGRINPGIWERAISRSSRQKPPFFLTHDEIGKVLRVSRERIGQVEAEALRRLQKKRSKLLEYY